MVSNDEILDFLKASKLENKKQNDDIKQELSDLRNVLSREIQQSEHKIKKLADENHSLKQKVLYLERKNKKFNLVVYGLKENDEDLIQNILQLLNNTLKIKCDQKDIRDIYYFGKNVTEKPRPICIELLYYNLKIEILKKGYLLKGSGIFIDNDYPKEDYDKRKFLKSQVKLAKEKKYTAKIKNNTLIINGDIYTYEELKAKSEDTREEFDQSNSSLSSLNNTYRQMSASAPSTPKPFDFVLPHLPIGEKHILAEKETITKSLNINEKKRDLEEASPDKEKPAAKKERSLSRNRSKKI